jgi:DNA-binding CsgD family transcriptional regulator
VVHSVSYASEAALASVRAAIACEPQTPANFVALVLISPKGNLLGLTRRELEVLGFIIDGRTHQNIGRALFITERTVAAHLEHIRAKLDAPTPLYIPHQLA